MWAMLSSMAWKITAGTLSCALGAEGMARLFGNESVEESVEEPGAQAAAAAGEQSGGSRRSWQWR